MALDDREAFEAATRAFGVEVGHLQQPLLTGLQIGVSPAGGL